MSYRQLTREEINILVSHNCSSNDWDCITVPEDFSPENIADTRFEGEVKLGVNSAKIEIEKDVSKTCGIYNSFISNCEIGNNVFISGVKDLSNYNIEEDVVLINIGSAIVTGETTFGNGTEIEVLNEGGGRELPVFDRLSAQIGYLAVLYRHDERFTENLLGLIRAYCKSKRSLRGYIGTGARLRDITSIRNVSVGRHAFISGASCLEEGTINSCREAPASIGTGVVARKFIILSGSAVENGVILDRCFVGQGVKIGKQFSAENSVFFANCEAYHGEACSLFAGPYTVTHHKSTLLIACLLSFFNAGSGTNQSNHMYKLGPLHQGILERGSKTGSFSYLLLPSHIGPYTAVMGKHSANFDTSDFPFSYISEEKGRSELTPAMNLFTVGTRRDADKWPVRDRRKDPAKLDLIHFGLLNPYIAGKIMSGISILNDLSAKTDQKQDWICHKGISIHRLLLKTTRKYYEMAIKIYAGQEVAKRLNGLNSNSTVADLKHLLLSDSGDGNGKWLDICGMFSPASKIGELIESVKSLRINTIELLQENLKSIFENYEKYSWEWCSGLISRLHGDRPENLPVSALVQIISDWKLNAVKLNNMTLKDAEKEFDASSKLGYGMDGGNSAREEDFLAVRGTYGTNKFVISLQNESREIEEKAGMLITILEKMK